MEQLFAVRVLVHYHDKSNVDHPAVRRLLSAAAVDSLRLLLADGTSVTLSSYIQTQPTERKPIVEITGSSGSSLTQVASVFMLAEARAAADALPSSPQELETACSALERLLGCLTTKRPLVPVRDIKQSARVKFGTAARRRAALRLSQSGADPRQEVSILKAVNAILRLCDVATHCMAVVSRQSVASKQSCETAVALSTRLLTLAASLYDVQQADVNTTPALSFFSSNSLRTALVAGAMHLGAIAIEHLEIEPMTWIHVANRIVMSSSTSIVPRTSVLSALFGGMIKASKRYESSERDSKAAEGAVCLLSTLHVVLEADSVRDTQPVQLAGRGSGVHAVHTVPNVPPTITLGTGAISQAARSFLGERVVAAEEDGDEGRIAARTVYQACEEYAERTGESDGMMGLLSRLFASAGRQCRLESADDSVVSISESALTCQPDESDASSDGPHARPESPPFTLDVFDQRSRDGFGMGATIGSCSEAGVENPERTDLHREVGALALDTLAHWISRAPSFPRYANLRKCAFTANICKSASFFSFTNSPASYDLRSAMTDFGSLLGPIVLQEIDESSEGRDEGWKTLVSSLVGICSRMNPILSSILRSTKDSIVVSALLQAFVQTTSDPEALVDLNVEVTSSLPAESLLLLLMSLISDANSIDVVEILSRVVLEYREEQAKELSLLHRASILILLSFAIRVTLGVSKDSDAARVAVFSLYNRDAEGISDPALPSSFPEVETLKLTESTTKCSPFMLGRLVSAVSAISQAIDVFCFQPNVPSCEDVAKFASDPPSKQNAIRGSASHCYRDEKQRYHLYWSCLMLHECLCLVESLSRFKFDGFAASTQAARDPAKSSPFVCMQAMESEDLNSRVMAVIGKRKRASLTVLYMSDCMAMVHPQRQRWVDHKRAFSGNDLQRLFTAIVQNTIEVASDLVFEDVAGNFRGFFKSFTAGTDISTSYRASTCAERPPVGAEISKRGACFACLQLAMTYMRAIGSGQVPNLLASVLSSATQVLSCLTHEQLDNSKTLILEVATIYLFLPESFGSLAAAVSEFLKRFLELLFQPGEDAVSLEEIVVFVARVTGFSKVLQLGSSVTGMHLLCRLTHDMAKAQQEDMTAVRVSLLSEETPNKFGKDLSLWLNSSLPRASFSDVLTILLVPQDDSAVAVSAHAQSVSLLTDACEISPLWTDAILQGWIGCEGFDHLTVRMVRRSVMQSATMNESVVALFERVVGESENDLAPRAIREAFEAACHVFGEEADVSIEGRVRLLNFAVRLSVLYGRSSRKSPLPFSPPLLEPVLFNRVVESLERMTKILQGRNPDFSLRQIVLLLCGLLDCYLAGILGDRTPIFSGGVGRVGNREGGDSSGVLQSDEKAETVAEGRGETVSESDTQESGRSEEAPKSSLCTYTTTGSQFVEQHWYFCYSCGLAGSEGVCSVCARICHKGCELAYSKFSRFFCDCGAGSDPYQENTSNQMSASEDGDGGNGVSHDSHSQAQSSIQTRKRKTCRCLKSPHRKERVSKSQGIDQTVAGKPSSSDDLLSATNLRELLVTELKAIIEPPSEEEGRKVCVRQVFENTVRSGEAIKSLVQSALYLVRALDGAQKSNRLVRRLPSSEALPTQLEAIRTDPNFVQTSHTVRLAQWTRMLKAGSVDTSGISPVEKSLSSHKSPISYSSVGNMLAVGHRAGYIEFIDGSEIAICGVGTVDKNAVSDYPRATVPFDVVGVQFHHENANLLLVSGTEKLTILCRTQENGSYRWKQYNIELGLSEFDGFEGHNVLAEAKWIEGGPALVLVTTPKFVKLFDASKDTFCPRFYSTVPSKPPGSVSRDNSTSTLRSERAKKTTIQGATAAPILLDGSGTLATLILLVSSEQDLFVSVSREQGEEAPQFTFLFDVRQDPQSESKNIAVTGMCYHPADSLVAVSFEDGALLCASVSIHGVGKDVAATVLWAHLFREAVSVGAGMALLPVPGKEASFMFGRRGETLKAAGVLKITANRTARVHYFSGSPSASVLGLTTYAASPSIGNPACDGGFLILDDGSLHRADWIDEQARAQTTEESVLAGIVERQRLRSVKASNLNSDPHLGYNAVPASVGFFEKCRLVADQISIERLGEEDSSESSLDRMTVTLAGGGGDCVVSLKENEPFKFIASVENRSVVLVGARLKFGGTDRSRNRVPSEVKVFGRVVKWQPQNGVKRWLDIPFSVPESVESPQRVNIELVPRRKLGESRGGGDGFVAVDALELYAVSNIEFTERKLVFEKDKSKHFERMKARKEAPEHRCSKRYSELLSSVGRTSGNEPIGYKFSQDQAALLTVLQCIHSNNFAMEMGSDVLLLEINNLWSAVFEGSPSRDPAFLRSLLKPCLRLFVNVSESEASMNMPPNETDLPARGVKHCIESLIQGIPTTGILCHLDSIERSLFAVAGMARSLLMSGCSSVQLDPSSWIKSYQECMPKSTTISVLLRSHVGLGTVGRALYKSSHGATINVVDIVMAQNVHHAMEGPGRAFNLEPPTVRVLVQMVSSIDQKLRLFVSQRLIDLFDSPESAAQLIGSPFETLLATALAKRFDGAEAISAPPAEVPTGSPQVLQDSESTQRWAYRCDSCGEVCDQEWWHCNDCEDFDLCTSCLRRPVQSFEGSHNENHLLLRGSAVDDSPEPDMAEETETEVSRMLLVVQEALRPFIDEYLKDLFRESDCRSSWRFVEGAEVIAQLVGHKCPRHLRLPRLKALFSSSFTAVLTQASVQLGNDLANATADYPRSQGLPHNSDGLYLMLRILQHAKGSVAPVFLHENGIPAVLFGLLKNMHRRLQLMFRALSSGQAFRRSQPSGNGFMSWSAWNHVIPGFSYDVLPHRTKCIRSEGQNGRLCHLSDELGVGDSLLLNLLIATLDILEYAFRAASSAAITVQMQALSRSVLCDVINFCEAGSSYIHDKSLLKEAAAAATRVVSALEFDDRNTLNNILDKYKYEEESARLKHALSDNIGGGNVIVEYDTTIEVASIVGNLHKAAERHPTTWRSFVMDHEELLLQLLLVAEHFEGQVQINSLQLLASGLAVSADIASRIIRGHAMVDMNEIGSLQLQGAAEVQGRRKDVSRREKFKGPASVTELIQSGQKSPQVPLSIFEAQGFNILHVLVHQVMLKSQSKAARNAASQLLILGIARAAGLADNEAFVIAIQSALLKGVELMPYAGDLADGLMSCLRFFIRCCQGDLFGLQSESLLTRLTIAISTLLNNRCTQLISHPNARLYGRLSTVLEMNGYYLESDPCMSCSAAICESSESKDCRLDTIRAETKYTDNSIMHRLISVHEVSSISVKIIDPRRSRRAKTIAVYYSSRSVSDAAELKGSNHPWRSLRALELGPTSSESSVDLIVPVAAANVKFQFVDFYNSTDVVTLSKEGRAVETAGADGMSIGGRRSTGSSGPHENLQCPRCSRAVTDRHGICRNCHENAYQCRQCRNINYENLDGFLCNECGYCKHGRFEFSVMSRPTFVAERITNEDDRKRASRTIEKETSNVHRCMDQLTRMRSSIIRSLNSGIPTEETKERGRILGNARIGLADLLDSVAPRTDIAVLEALLEGQTSHEIEEAANSTQGGISITEEVIAESSGSADPSERGQNNPTTSSVASPLNRGAQSRISQAENGIVSKTAVSLSATYSKDCRSIYTTMSRGIRVLTLTRAELVRYANAVGGSRLQYANDIAVETSTQELNNESPALQAEANPYSSGLTTSCCYGCTQSFISKCVRLVQTIVSRDSAAASSLHTSDLARTMMLVCSLCEKSDVRGNIRDLISHLVNDNLHATQLVCKELARKIEFCIESFETIDAHSVARFEMAILETTATIDDNCWEERLRLVIRLLFKSSSRALTCSSVAESVILPCLRVALRLMRAESELTVLENSSGIEGYESATDITSHEAQPLQASENSETENDEIDHSVQATLSHSVRDTEGPIGDSADAMADRIARAEAADDPMTLLLAHSVFNGTNLGTSVDAPSSVGSREPTRPEERRQMTSRGGSDFMSGSRAPSSIGTAFDGHISDEEGHAHAQRQDADIDIRIVSNMLESDHDSKLLSADVGQWLEGRFDQSVWIAEMKERSVKCARKQVASSSAEASNCPSYLKILFSAWKQLVLEEKTQSNAELLNDDETGSQNMKRLSIEKDNWIVRLMLFTPCATVRKEACSLLQLLCGQEEALQLQLLDVLTGSALSLGADVGEKSKEYFDLLESTLMSRSHRLYLIAKGFLPRLAAIIRSRAERLILSEANAESSLRLVNFLEGYSLKRLLCLLRLTLDVIPSQRIALREKLFRVDNYKLVWSLQRAYICMRKLISLRTKLTDECGAQLCEVLLSKELLFAGPTVSAVVSACVSELKSAKERNDAQAIGILLEQLCQMLCPERKEPICYLSLNKAPTQEEFIRGSMSRNPYPSSAFEGPLMRDVKNKICKDLDLPGLLEDDFAMELLVAGNLVKLDLPIMGVYNHVWRGSAAAMSSAIQPTQITRTFGLRRASPTHSRGNMHGSRNVGMRSTILTFRRVNNDRDSSEEDGRSDSRAEPPMTIIYRLSGLDGEATEPIVDSLPTETNDDEDVEELYADTIIFGEVGGLGVLFELLAIVGSWGDDAETAVRAPALRLLRASCEVAQNRTLLAKSSDAVRTLLDCAASAFEHAQGSPTAVISAESLLIAAEQILAQQRKELENDISRMPDAVSLSSDDPDDVLSRVRVFLGRLAVATWPKAENSILHLLPFLIQGVPAAIDVVLEYFHFSCETIDGSANDQKKAKQLGTVLFATPNDLRGDTFAQQTIRTEIGVNAVEYIVKKFPIPRNDHKTEWGEALERPGPPLVLRLLTSLSLFLHVKQSRQGASSLLREILAEQTKIIPVLCQLEMAVSDNAIGTTAEELLEALGKDDDIRVKIDSEREAIKKARRKAATASRMAILRESGLIGLGPQGEVSKIDTPRESPDTGTRDADFVQQLIEELPDEIGPSCVVCGDGFRCRPEDALAFYVHCRKVPLDLSIGLPSSSAKGGSETVLGSVQGSSRVELEIWSSGRTRSANGLPSRSGGNSCYTTVTHLNAIHLACHKEAARVDRTSRRDEWDGASLRNSQTRCNNLFPVRPPASFKGDDDNRGDESIAKSAKMSYSAAVDGYFGRLSSLGRTSLSHAKGVTYDLGRCMLRFADGGTSVFSEHAKGGGPHSNACLIPHFVQLAIYMVEVAPQKNGDAKDLFDSNSSLLTQEAALTKFVEEEEIGDITYYLASALVLQPLLAWKSSLRGFLRRGLIDKVLKSEVLFRLIAFSDLVNRRLKAKVKVVDGQHWLDSLRRHIGLDETFAQGFGDSVNERWEGYIRRIGDEKEFVRCLARNAEIDDEKEEDAQQLFKDVDDVIARLSH